MKSLVIILTGVVSVFFFLPATLLSEYDVLLDEIDLGTDLASFEEHDGTGWGPVEPATHGGSWGAIATDPDSPDGSCRAIWFENGVPEDPDAATAMVTLFPHPGSTRGIVMRTLDGVADDSFTVFVLGKHGDFVEVYSCDSDPSTEEYWVVHEIEIPVNQIKAGRPLTVKIDATGSAWSQFNTYGQLAVDWIELWGNGSP